MTNLNGETADIANENIQALTQLFPDIICEGKIDFDKLKQILGDYIDDDKERYNFSWNGKGKSLRLAQTPSMGTLRPCVEESKNFDTTENLYIEGDNLEVLKLLQKSYHNKVKMIYIDPPYNTGNDFVYLDNFTDSLENYKQITGQLDEDGNKISTNNESNGRFHTDWLNMMYPRLRLARNLLTDDGVIFISIDDNEQANLKKLCDEIFGEQNFFAILTRRCMHTVRNSSKDFNKNSDFILTYSKNKSYYAEDKDRFIRAKIDKSSNYKLNDNDGKGYYKLDPIYARNYASPYQFTFKNGFVWEAPQGSFPRYSQATLSYKEEHNELNLDGKEPRAKRYLNEVQIGQPPDTFMREEDVGFNSDGTKDLANSIKHDKIFNQPKPIKLIKYLINILPYDDNDIILDFFSGSATTAHAVMQLNAEDGGNRKYICVQLPEPCAEKSEAHKAEYKNICEIGKERIRRAGDKINVEIAKNHQQLNFDGEEIKPIDSGFKVFKLDTSNLKKWQPDYENIEGSLINIINNFVDGRTEKDVVYEIMIKMGLALSSPIDEKIVNGKIVYCVDGASLMMCLDDGITTDIATRMTELYTEYNPPTWKVVFKDNGFKPDSDKTNIKEILKCAGLDEDAFVTV